MKVAIDGYGEVEAVATALTLFIYEREFKDENGKPRDLIAEVFGRHKLEYDEGYIDFTVENWNAEVRALWAMVKTANVLADRQGKVAPVDRVPGFDKWIEGVMSLNMREVAQTVVQLASDGFFRTGAAASD